MTRPPDEPLPVTLEDLGSAGDAGALSHYSDPAYYTKTYGDRDHDVDYYVDLARAVGGPVLEYGVGNGRVALPIARLGIPVEGVDLSQPMLADLARRLRDEPEHVRDVLRVHQGDMRTLRLARRFALAIVPFNGILHLYEHADVRAFFARVREHLLPDGLFVFDFSVPSAKDLARDPERWYRSPRLRHPSTGQLVRYAERFEYDPIRQLLLVTMRFEPEHGEPWIIPLTHRQFFPQEMLGLLEHAGFTDVSLLADFSELPADRATDSAVVVCRSPGEDSPDRPREPYPEPYPDRNGGSGD